MDGQNHGSSSDGASGNKLHPCVHLRWVLAGRPVGSPAVAADLPAPDGTLQPSGRCDQPRTQAA
eukprot:12587987-Alexandrium_andersonii.AAC.1